MAQLILVFRLCVAWLLTAAATNATQRNSTNLRGGNAFVGGDSTCDSVPRWSACIRRRCCAAGDKCYRKDAHYAQCQPAGTCSRENGAVTNSRHGKNVRISTLSVRSSKVEVAVKTTQSGCCGSAGVLAASVTCETL
eukprot:symbB.v1.2.030340.t1/scaffold3410.1/size62789/1